jgi:hypothetical protein
VPAYTPKCRVGKKEEGMPVAKDLSKMSGEEIEKIYGVKVKNGKIAVSGGKFYAVIEGKKHKIDLQYAYSSKPVDELWEDGTPAGFVVIEGQPVVIIARPGKYFPAVLCYIAINDVKKRIDNQTRTKIVDMLINESRIPKELGNQIINELGIRK